MDHLTKATPQLILCWQQSTVSATNYSNLCEERIQSFALLQVIECCVWIHFVTIILFSSAVLAVILLFTRLPSQGRNRGANTNENQRKTDKDSRPNNYQAPTFVPIMLNINTIIKCRIGYRSKKGQASKWIRKLLKIHSTRNQS